MTYVEGIGDEVLLFFTFIIASFGILLFLFLRETFRRNNNNNNISNQTSDSVDTRDDSSVQTRSNPATDFQQRTPVGSVEYFSATTISATENVTGATRSNEQQCITLRLVLQERTINAQLSYSTTLQQLKRYDNNRVIFVTANGESLLLVFNNNSDDFLTHWHSY